MKKQLFFLFLISYFCTIHSSYSQDNEKSNETIKISKLFRSQEKLPIKLSYSNKDLKRNTNDSTYIKSELSYQLEDGSWKTLEVDLRARGNFRRKNCYFSPLKIKIKKTAAIGTLFKGNKKLKLVLPCSKGNTMNDNIVKEYMAYKLYESISPYHFKTRMVNIDYTEIRNKKTENHQLKGILIEDDDKIAKRYNGSVLKRPMHPLNQDAICSVQNAFFQFMISNTDYSTAYRHNEKLLFIDKKMIPVPYDFDMSGLVDASYAVVSEIQNEALDIKNVKQRLYRGFKRDEQVLQQIRKQYLDNKTQALQTINSLSSEFNNQKEFEITKTFISDFYEIIASDIKFKKQIIDRCRTK
jgi:hypothetical protein